MNRTHTLSRSGGEEPSFRHPLNLHSMDRAEDNLNPLAAVRALDVLVPLGPLHSHSLSP